MLVLAIALPVTTNLVQKNQENRSQAAADGSGCVAKGGECINTSPSKLSNGAVCTKPSNGWAGKVDTGLCPGDSYNRCCVQIEDKGCGARGGTCRVVSGSPGDGSAYENGTIAYNLCGGSSNIRCWIPNAAAPAPVAPAPEIPAPVAPVVDEPTLTCEGRIYLIRYSDIKNAGINPQTHYDTQGKNEGRVWNSAVCVGDALNYCEEDQVKSFNCVAGCDSSNSTCRDECTVGQTLCTSTTVLKYCEKQSDGGIRWNSETCENGCSSGACLGKTDGVCGASNNACTSGTLSDIADTQTEYKWKCVGSNNGATTDCSVAIPTTLATPKLSFQVSFAGVTSNMACLNKFSQVTVSAGKVGTDIAQDLTVNLTAVDADSNGLQVFEASEIIALEQDKFGTGGSNNFVKIKGSLHARMAYCNNGQTSKKSVLTGCTLPFDGTIYDFSKYPILAGDVNQDGVINAIDFSLVKNNLSTDDELAAASAGNPDCDNDSDLNGDGVVNNLDINLVKNSLSYKDDEN